MSSEASHPRPFGILKIQRVFLTEFEECAFSKYFLNLNSTAFSDSVRFLFLFFLPSFSSDLLLLLLLHPSRSNRSLPTGGFSLVGCFFWGVLFGVASVVFFFLEDDARAARWLMRGADDGRRAAFGPLSLDDSAAGHRTVTDRCLFSSTQSKRPIAGRLSEHLSGPHRYGRFSLSLSLSLFLSIFLSFVFFVCVPARARVCVCGVGKDDSRRWVLLSSMGFHQKFSRFLGVYLVRIP